MRDEAGHFTLEAVVGLAIASLVLLAAQWAQGNAVNRLARARVLWAEVVRLQDATGCVVRLGVEFPTGVPGPTPRAPGCEAFVVVAGNDPGSPLRSIQIESEGRPLILLTLGLKP